MSHKFVYDESTRIIMPKFKREDGGTFVIRMETQLLKDIDDLWRELRFKSRNDFIRFVLSQAVKGNPLAFEVDQNQLAEWVFTESKKYIDRVIGTFFGQRKKGKENAENDL